MTFICFLVFAMAVYGAQSLESEAEKAFIANEIVPDVLSAAPKKALNVGFSILYFFDKFSLYCKGN